MDDLQQATEVQYKNFYFMDQDDYDGEIIYLVKDGESGRLFEIGANLVYNPETDKFEANYYRRYTESGAIPNWDTSTPWSEYDGREN